MKKSLGQKIREWRMKKGITQTELAEGLVTPSMISQIESDKANPSFKLLEGISHKLEVPIDEFLMDMQDQLEQDTRHKLAVSLMGSKEYQKAIGVFESLLGAEEVEQEKLKMELAEAYVEARQFDKATKLLEGMLEGISLDRDRSRAVNLLRWLGRTKMLQHDYVMAKHYLSQALKELVKSEEVSNEDEAILYNFYAQTLTYLGELTEALDFYNRGILATEKTSNLDLLGKSYMGLSSTYYRIGDFKKAAEAIRISITMFRSVNNKLFEIRSKLNFGIYQYEMDNFKDALIQFHECVEEFEQIGQKERVADTYGEIGKTYFRMGEYQEAEKWCYKALELSPSVYVGRADIYKTLGILYQKLGNFDRASEYMISSVEMFENLGLRGEATKCYSYIVSIYQARGELDKASSYMQKMTSSMQEGLRERGLYL
ncbi:MAG TPA: tetratricopeptide repeat protein [Bacilli bacterium]|nr:tetratricopeptide repeat protein [Bacilli bacterium]